MSKNCVIPELIHHLISISYSIDALVEAVKDFRGGLIVVSHDQHFITNTCSELWVVGELGIVKMEIGLNPRCCKLAELVELLAIWRPRNNRGSPVTNEPTPPSEKRISCAPP